MNESEKKSILEMCRGAILERAKKERSPPAQCEGATSKKRINKN